jgi:membrane protease YdiL (CAAX protease family)
MENKNKYPEPVEALVVILLAFGSTLIVTLLLVEALSQFDSLFSSDDLNRLFFIFGGAMFLLVPLLYVRSKKYDIPTLLRLRNVSGEIIQLSFLIGITIAIVGDELDRLVQLVFPLPDFLKEFVNIMVAGSIFDWFVLIIGAVLIAAIGEEVLFRGFLQVTLEKKGDVTRAVILTSLSWTLIHANPYWAIQIFSMGVIIGFLAWRTDSVYPGIIVHATNNFISLMFYNFNLNNQWGWYLMGDHINPLILLPSIALLVWCIKRITNIYQSEEY